MPGREKRTGNVNFRISETGRWLLDTLQEHLGISMASVIEVLLREEARRRNITIPGSGMDLTLRAAERAEEAERIARKAQAMTTGSTERGKKG